LYLFGAFSPITGAYFTLELPNCDTNNFQVFLDEFSKQDEDELKIMLLDNGAFHKAKLLKIPNNIELVFIPPYSPELNPAEKIWWKMKRDFTGKLHYNLEAVSEFITKQVNNLTPQKVKNICNFQYLFLYPFWTKLY
jgi:transposase